MEKIKPGDHVLHRLTNTTMVVAYADYEKGWFSWCGWPEGRGPLDDIELVKSATEDESQEIIELWAAKTCSDDHRPRAVRRLYR